MAENLDQMKSRLLELKGQLLETLDPAAARRLNEEIKKLSHQISVAEAAAAKFKRVLDTVKGTLQNISNVGSVIFTALSATIARTVQVADPARWNQFQLALRDLAGVVGKMLAPVLEKVTQLIRMFADWLNSLSAGTKKAIVGIVGVALATSVLLIVIPQLISQVVALTTAVVSLDIAAAGIPIAIGLVVTGIAALIQYGGSLKGVMDSLSEAFAPVMGALNRLWAVFQEGFGVLQKTFSVIMENLQPAFEMITPLIESIVNVTTSLMRIWVAWQRVVGGLANAFMPLVKAIFQIAQQIQGALLPIVELVADVFAELAEVLGELLVEILKPIAEFIKTFVVPIFEFWVSILKQLKEILIDTIKLLREFLGLSGRQVPKVDNKDKKSSVGAGGREASFMSGEELQRKAILAAVKVSGGNPEVTANAIREKMLKELMELNRKQKDAWDRDRARNI